MMRLDESGLLPETNRPQELLIADGIYQDMRRVGLPDFAWLEFDLEFKGESFEDLKRLQEFLNGRCGYAMDVPRWSWFSRSMKGRSATILVDRESIQVWVAELVGHARDFRCRLGDWGALLDLPRVFCYERRGSAASDRFKEGVAAHEAGLLTKAFCHFREATLEDPDCAEGFDGMASVQLQLWLLSDALGNCERAVALSPEEPSFRLNRGAARDYLGDSTGALADYDSVIALLPRCSKAYLNRGNTKWGTGDRQGAFADWMRARDLGCDWADAYLRRFASEVAE